jgi:hypothetical protein
VTAPETALEKVLRQRIHTLKLDSQKLRRAYGDLEREIESACAPRLGYEKFEPGEPGYNSDFVNYNIGDHVAETLVAALGNALDAAHARLARMDALLIWLSAPDRTAAVEVAVARALVREQSSGLCRYDQVCELCDCFAATDGGADRDAQALALARAVLKDLNTLRVAAVRPCPECGVVLEFHWPDCSLNPEP